MAQQTLRGHPPDQFTTIIIEIAVTMKVIAHLTGGKVINLTCQITMSVFKERPVEEALVRHGQFPSKTGFCFAAKASNARVKSSVCMQMACACASASIA